MDARRPWSLILALAPALVACGGDDATGAPGDGGGIPIDAPIDTSPPPTCPADNQGPGAAPNGTAPGALTFPSPTLRHATVVWAVTGDTDADAEVTVRFRRQGDTGWRRALHARSNVLHHSRDGRAQIALETASSFVGSSVPDERHINPRAGRRGDPLPRRARGVERHGASVGRGDPPRPRPHPR